MAIVHRNDFVRAGIEAILRCSPRFEVCGVARSERGAIQLIDEYLPNVVILDLFLGHRDGIYLVKALVARYPEMATLVLSEYSDLTYAKRAVRAGAQGFLVKDATAEELCAAIDRVQRGQRYLTRRFAFLIDGQDASMRPAAEDNFQRLTDRELHVFRLIGVGLGTGEIARQLGLSRKTIECYNANIKHKLGCADAASMKARARAWMARAESRPATEVSGVKLGKPGIIPDSHLVS